MALRNTRGRPLAGRRRSTMTVSPGAWIRVAVPGDPFPVKVHIEGQPTRAAFIDHEVNAAGESQTVAAFRCPPIRAGEYAVAVVLPDGDRIETSITVV